MNESDIKKRMLCVKYEQIELSKLEKFDCKEIQLEDFIKYINKHFDFSKPEYKHSICLSFYNHRGYINIISLDEIKCTTWIEETDEELEKRINEANKIFTKEEIKELVNDIYLSNHL